MTIRKYAHIKIPTFSSIKNNLLTFDSLFEAKNKLIQIERDFVTKKNKEREEEEEILELWIHGFEITPDEKQKGTLGNFGKIEIHCSHEKFILKLTKNSVPVKFHPHRKRLKAASPNWGHPTLRIHVKGRRPFQTKEEARKKLRDLYEEFPKTTIPANEDKHYVMVFNREKKREKKPPIEKIVLQIEKEESSGLYFLEYVDNNSPTKWLNVKIFPQNDSVFLYGYGAKSVVDQDDLSKLQEAND